MAIDPVAEYLDELEERYGLDAELADAVLAVEVRHDFEDDSPSSTVEGRVLSARNTSGVGILYRSLHAFTNPDPDE